MDITNNSNSSFLCDQCKNKLTIRSYCSKFLNKYKLISKGNKKKAVNAQQKGDVKDFYKCENCVGKLIKDLCRQCRTFYYRSTKSIYRKKRLSGSIYQEQNSIPPIPNAEDKSIYQI